MEEVIFPSLIYTFIHFLQKNFVEKEKTWKKQFCALFGPGLLISIAYLDPGNC